MLKQKSELLMPLGSGAIDFDKYGYKAAGLDFAKLNGLPVPGGVVLKQEYWDWINKEKLAENFLAREISNLSLGSKISVRSAFSIEDSAEKSYAGFFRTVLNLDKRDFNQIVKALREVWSSAEKISQGFSRSILIMEMIPSKFSGVAFTESEFEDDCVNWTEGLGDRLVSGEVAGKRILIPKIRKRENSVTPLGDFQKPGFYHRLQRLIRDIRKVFGEKEWDIEWADDGKHCWLLQIRPITRPLAREEWYGLSNHKEILPPLPSTFMNSLIKECSPDIFSIYHQIDPDLPQNRPLIKSFKGRPYFNYSLLSEMIRSWGLPTNLLKQAMGGVS